MTTTSRPTLPVRTMLHAAVLLVSAVLTLGLAACGDGPAAATIEAQGVGLEARRGDIASKLLLTGKLEAEDAIELTTPNANVWPVQVRYIVDDGVDVAAGDVVAELDNSQLAANLEQLELAVIDAENRLESERARVATAVANAEMELARRRAERAKAKLDAEVPADIQSAAEYERRQLDHETKKLEAEEAEGLLETARQAAEADVGIARLALEKTRGEVERVRSSIDRLVLKAPRPGVVVVGRSRDEPRPLKPGDSVFPGFSLASLPNLESLRVRARLFDVDDGRVVPGQSVGARLDAFPDQEITGRVREVAEMAQGDTFSTRRFFDVTIDLEEIDVERLRPGMSVQLVIETARVEDALLVPRAALIDPAGDPHVHLASGELLPVELGVCDARECVVAGEPEELRPGTVLMRATATTLHY